MGRNGEKCEGEKKEKIIMGAAVKIWTHESAGKVRLRIEKSSRHGPLDMANYSRKDIVSNQSIRVASNYLPK